MKTIFLFFGIVCNSLFLFGQEVNYSNISIQRPHIPQSPNSASLGFNSNFPVSNFTALPDISIPIVQLPFGDQTADISLRYNPNLIQINSIPTNVGFGWTLNAGGTITRTIKGIADDRSFPCFSGMLNLFRPIPDISSVQQDLVYNYIDDLRTDNSCLTAFQLFNLSSTAMRSSGFGCQGGVPDTEADIFYYNFMGRTGKFIIKNRGNSDYEFRQIPYSNLKFEVRFGTSTPPDWNGPPNGHYLNLIIGFTVIDEFGVKYMFDAVEKTEQRISSTPYYLENDHNSPQSFGGDGFTTANTSWNLTQIVTPEQEEVNFSYENETLTYISPTQNTFRNCPDGNCQNASNASSETNDNFPQRAFVRVGNKLYSKRIKEISAKAGKIIFFYDQLRIDLGGSKALTGVKLFNNKNEIVKNTELQYFYLNCLGNDSQLEKPFLATDYESNNNINKRLMLRGINDVSTDGLLKTASNKFDYNNFHVFPVRGSFEQDFWGFYNGNNARTLVPKQYIYPSAPLGANRYRIFPLLNYTGIVLPGADRYANESFITTAMLNKITYPTGGFTQFKFESNDFLLDGIENVKGGGVRIKQIVTNDGIAGGGINKVLDYAYTEEENGHPERSSGRLLAIPSFAYVENTLSYLVTGNGEVNARKEPSQNPYNSFLYQYFLSRNCFPSETLNGFDGLSVAYKYVTELQGGNGKIQYNFSMPAIYGDSNDLANSPNPAVISNCNLIENGYCDNIFEASKTYYCEAPTFHPNCTTPARAENYFNADNTGVGLNTSYVHPFASNLNYDWNRGHILSKKILDNSGRKILEEKFTYENFTKDRLGPKFLNCVLIRNLENYSLSPNIYGEVMYFSKYKIISDIAKLVKEKEVRIFTDHGSSINEKIIYKYKNSIPVIDEITEVGSKAEVSKKRFYHSFDLSTSYPFNEMKNNNQIYELVKLEESTNAIINKTTEKLFLKPNPSLPSYKAFKVNEISDGISKETFSISSFTSNVKADEYSGTDGIIQSLLFDNNNVTVIANVKNAKNSDIGFTSFESFENGTWIYAEGDVLTSNNSLTGQKVFNGNLISKTGLNSSLVYIVSYWRKSPTINPCNIPGNISGNGYPKNGPTVNGWTFYEHLVSGISSVNISENFGASIDELRIFPKGALMTSFTKKNLIGLTSENDENNNITYYEYDEFNRLSLVRDCNKNIQKRICYKYFNQIGSCDEKIYAKLYLENIVDQTYEKYADIVVKFYSDVACTQPVSVNNLLVNFLKVTSSNSVNFNGNSQNFNLVANGTSSILLSQAETYASDGSLWLSHEYIIQTGNGYLPIN